MSARDFSMEELARVIESLRAENEALKRERDEARAKLDVAHDAIDKIRKIPGVTRLIAQAMLEGLKS